jgi:hypothetical protein
MGEDRTVPSLVADAQATENIIGALSPAHGNHRPGALPAADAGQAVRLVAGEVKFDPSRTLILPRRKGTLASFTTYNARNR